MTRLLIGVLALVAAYFFLYEEKHRKADLAEKAAERKLFPFSPDSVQKFILVNPDSERIDVERRGEGWAITAPVAAPGDKAAIDALIGQIVPGRRAGEIGNVGNLSDYGLERPFATIIVFAAGRLPDTLEIGDKTPTSSNTYVRFGGSKNVLISLETTHNIMHKSLYHLRDKTFLSFPSESVDGIVVRNDRASLELVRVGSEWWLARPRVRADRVKVERYLTALTAAIVRSFAREDTADLAPFGFGRPERSVTLTEASETTTVSFGKSEGDEVYAVRSGLDKVTLLEGSLLAAFDWSPGSIRGMNLAYFSPDSVSVIRYETPETTAVLRRSGAAWTQASGDSIPASRAYRVGAFLRRLNTTTFDTIIAEPAQASDRRLARWSLKISLEGRAGSGLDRITIADAYDTAQVGTSISAGVLGRLSKNGFRDIRSSFARIGAR